MGKKNKKRKHAEIAPRAISLLQPRETQVPRKHAKKDYTRDLRQRIAGTQPAAVKDWTDAIPTFEKENKNPIGIFGNKTDPVRWSGFGSFAKQQTFGAPCDEDPQARRILIVGSEDYGKGNLQLPRQAPWKPYFNSSDEIEIITQRMRKKLLENEAESSEELRCLDGARAADSAITRNLGKTESVPSFSGKRFTPWESQTSRLKPNRPPPVFGQSQLPVLGPLRPFSTFNEFGGASQGFATQKKRLLTYGQPQEGLQETDNAKDHLGEAQQPLTAFGQPTPVQAHIVNFNVGKSKPRKTLEDLYNQHPEKRLRSIEPETLHLVVQIIQQIADEAANEWLQTSCPGTKWSDKTIAVQPLYDFNGNEVDYTIYHRAVCLQNTKGNVAFLLRQSRAKYRDIGAENLTMLRLVPMIDHCIGICQIVGDGKRKGVLEKTKEKLQWLPVGLDCKKLDIQRRASQALNKHNEMRRREPGQDFEKCGLAAKMRDDETEILDRALIEFHEYRLEFLVEFLRTLQQLLEATA